VVPGNWNSVAAATLGFAVDEPIQRLWRDVAIATRHAQLDPYIAAEDQGRLIFNVGTPASLTFG
jgi:hypothetical protein